MSSKEDFDSDASSAYAILSNEQYAAHLEEAIPAAEERVWVQTMSFDATGPFEVVKDLMTDAAERNVDTRFTTDAFYRLFLGGSVYYARYGSSAKRNKIDAIRTEREGALEGLRKSGVQVAITNPPTGLYDRINPARGRNHVKMAIVDDAAYVGDLNLVDRDKHGAMVHIRNPILVRELARLYEHAPYGPRGANGSVYSGDGTTLLIDGGTKRHSIILEVAERMIYEAKSSVRFANQYMPDGVVPRAMNDVRKQGVDVEFVTTRPDILSPIDRVFDRYSRMRAAARGLGHLPVYETPYWMHAKMLEIDGGTDRAQVLIGSHCLSATGVNYGTQEVMLHSTGSNLTGYVKEYIDDARIIATRGVIDKLIFGI